MTAPLEIVDTAVKIGTGALVSGVTTYWVAAIRHKLSVKENKFNRQVELLEQVARHAEEVNYVFLKYWELITGYIHASVARYEWPHNKKSELYIVVDELAQVFNELTVAESKLLLLNEKKVYKSLRKYRTKIIEFRRNFYIDRKDLSEHKALEAKREIEKLREQFFDALSERYRKN